MLVAEVALMVVSSELAMGQGHRRPFCRCEHRTNQRIGVAAGGAVLAMCLLRAYLSAVSKRGIPIDLEVCEVKRGWDSEDGTVRWQGICNGVAVGG